MPSNYEKLTPPSSAPGIIGGSINGSEMMVGIVASRFNYQITERLLQGAMEGAKSCGVDPSAIHLAWVPGALEIPIVAKQMATNLPINALVTLGAVIRGETTHYEVVSNGCASGVMQVSLEINVPIIFGVLTVENMEQAMARSMPDETNKGLESMESAIWCASVMERL
ncbi:MAG: 6,7-dimethyl-8-ribityllumazine synthase [Acidimicrobiales bacterium]|nr:6,7-dimethyl-8-ribityllumazine synthase [Acidimicrobiales bacterium]